VRSYLDGDGNHLDAIRARCRLPFSPFSKTHRCSRCGEIKPAHVVGRVNNKYVCAVCRAKGQLHA